MIHSFQQQIPGQGVSRPTKQDTLPKTVPMTELQKEQLSSISLDDIPEPEKSTRKFIEKDTREFIRLDKLNLNVAPQDGTQIYIPKPFGIQ